MSLSGVYDRQTINAVTKFQAMQGISQDGRVGFMAGGFLRYSFSPLISLGFEGMYSVKGTKAATNSDGDTADLRLSYLDLPLLLIVTANAGETLGFDFYAGASLNYRVKCGFAEGGSNMRDCENPWMQGEKVEWGIPAGVALGYYFGGGTLYVDLRYQLGLSDVLEGVTAENGGLQGYVKLGFPIM